MIQPNQMNKNVLVVGSTGLVGSKLIRQLVRDGHRVIGLSRAAPHPSRAALLAEADLRFGSILDDELLAELVGKADVCFHLASSTVPATSNTNPLEDIHVNLVGTVKLLQHVVRSEVKKVIFVSSGGTVYGNPQRMPIPETHSLEPISSYGIIKAAIEHYFRFFLPHNGIEHAILRVSNIYGPGQRSDGVQGVVATFIQSILDSKPIEIWGDGSSVRDYIYIDDVISALVAAMHYHGPETIFNIGSGKGSTLSDIICRIEDATGRRASIRYKPDPVITVRQNILDIERARLELGFSPRVELAEGIRQTVVSMAQVGKSVVGN